MVPLAAAILLLGACGNNSQSTQNDTTVDTLTSNNPFLQASTLPYQAPDFRKIKDSDFKPAILEGMKDNWQKSKKSQITTTLLLF